MSARYVIFKMAVKLLGVKKMTSLPQKEIIDYSRKLQKKINIPKNDKYFAYSDYLIFDKYHLLRAKNKDSKKAILYLYGGGMMMPSSSIYFSCAKKIARKTNCDLWYFHYPLCSDNSIMYSVKAVCEAYRIMLEQYDPQDITFYGFSSGGGLLVYSLLYNGTQNNPMPKPSKLIAIGLGSCPSSDEEYKKMLELEKKDFQVNPKYMDAMKEILRHGEDIPGYIIDGKGGNYSAMPETWIYYGEYEVLSAKAHMFETEFKKAKVPCHIVIREKMCHCYCILNFIPEAKKDYNDIIDIIKK